MPVSAQHRKRVLAAESRNPNVIGRNRGSGSFEFTANGGIGGCCLFICVQHPKLWKVFDKPVFVALPLARLLDTISVFVIVISNHLWLTSVQTIGVRFRDDFFPQPDNC